MKIEQIAIQLYTLRDFCKTAEELAQTAKRVRAIGYRAVQVSAVGPIPEAEIARILREEGLVCCATHEHWLKIINEPNWVVDRLGKLGCKYTAYPYPGDIDFTKESSIHALAKGLDASGAVLRRAGQVLTYHNHGIEFVKYGERTALDIIYGETKPENLQGEIDTYWVQHGGGDPVAWCKRLKNRLPLLHLKDYGYTPENAPLATEIGSGNLNFKEIIAAADASGCEWFIVEQDSCPGDPFVSVKMSFDYLQKNLLS